MHPTATAESEALPSAQAPLMLPPPAHPSVLLKALEARARKRFGQHFLSSAAAVERIVSLASIAPGEPVLEIGPGLGVLTEALLAAGARVTAVELDRDLAEALSERLSAAIECGALRIVQADAVGLDLAGLMPAPGAKCVSNLPYNVGTRILTQLLEDTGGFSRLVLMFQREVANRLLAQPGDRERGSLSVFAQSRARVRIGFRLQGGAFHPPPKVESAVLVFEPLAEPDLGGVAPERFDATARLLFRSPRKTLRRVIADAAGVEIAEAALAAAGVDGGLRPAMLDQGAVQRIAAALPEHGWR